MTSSFLAGAEMMTFLRAGVEVRLGLGRVGEEAGRLDDESAPSRPTAGSPGRAPRGP